MRTIQRTEAKYVCETCQREYSSSFDAAECEGWHYKFKAGDRVIYHTGSYGSEQGQLSPAWWPEEKEGVVIEVVADKCMVEFADRSREWCRNHLLSAKESQ